MRNQAVQDKEPYANSANWSTYRWWGLPGVNAVFRGALQLHEAGIPIIGDVAPRSCRLSWEDRLLATRFGVKAVQLIQERKFGAMISYQDYEILDAPLADAAHRLRLVAPDQHL